MIITIEDDDNTNYKFCAWNGPKRLGIKTGVNGNQWKNRDYPEIG